MSTGSYDIMRNIRNESNSGNILIIEEHLEKNRTAQYDSVSNERWQDYYAVGWLLSGEGRDT